MEHRSVGKSNEAASILRISNCFFSPDERTQNRSRILLDTSLSSIPVSNDSTRHSVTSRIHCNSRVFCHLIFSTRHLNATPGKRNNVEKFNSPNSGIDSNLSQLIRSRVQINARWNPNQFEVARARDGVRSISRMERRSDDICSTGAGWLPKRAD